MGLSRQRERAVAIQRYRVDGVDRMLVPMWLNARRVVDVRGITADSGVWKDIYRSI
jgi:hypothetical protein